MNWIHFLKKKLPNYRKNLYGYVQGPDGKSSVDPNNEFTRHSFEDGVPKIEQLLKAQDDRIIYGLGKNDVKKFTDAGLKNISLMCSINYPKYEIGRILGSVKLELIKRLNRMINEFTYGQVPENIFEFVRQEVDSELIKLCPQAIEKLPVMYAQLSSEDKIVYSEIASTCRRIIKDVADSLYPPSDKPHIDSEGREHKITESDYTNRILARIQQSIQSNNEKKVFSAMFQYVDGLLNSINSYASKGDHSEFTKTDAVRCIVYTYLLLGDILHYYIRPEGET
ncbi:hypothetical protein NKOR_04610 [Candidatus Nitrosopumilus koreensis AR1]|uniref:Uncharacterized protein n=1 Tax=Candidatus Nitrosopumilus koreensis AR1 TaxID=1229908 RepID=K0B752_9ARCH|nr:MULTISPECIES: hypothetical protein [Nitrosopumilus]AFS80810.1 hypothetical protein NKOR_04610 [Candidatus Nitrosopumilus koreensis AR1]